MNNSESVLTPTQNTYLQSEIFQKAYSMVEEAMLYGKTESAKSITYFYFDITDDEKGFSKLKSLAGIV